MKLIILGYNVAYLLGINIKKRKPFKPALTGIHFTPQNLEKKNFPFERWISSKCLVCYTLSDNATNEECLDAQNGSSVTVSVIIYLQI